jgi:hypothetical protein
MRHLPPVALFALALSACAARQGKPIDAARARLSHVNACSEKQVTARERPDLAPRAWTDLEPGRTAALRQHRAIVEAHGCGREVISYCALDRRERFRCRPTSIDAIHRVDERAGLATGR